MSELRRKIEEDIRARGPIPFSRYMQMCLYDPELGYYSRNARQFGKAGDFYTSSDVHAVFGRLMARQFEQIWRLMDRLPRIDIVELGPGRGLFAQDVLDWSEKKFPDFFGAMKYGLIEQSPALRQKIGETLAHRIDSGKIYFTEFDAIGKFPTIIFANEFFDALPVEVVSTQGSLRIDSNGRFVETWADASSEELEYLDRFAVHPLPGERIEACLPAQRAMENIAAKIGTGALLAIDYGYTRDEQLEGRHRGTVKSIRRHTISASPYEAPGEQDITADVNFTALAAAAEQNGMTAQKLVTQSQFLLGVGEENQFADAFEECRLPQEKAKVALQLKHLVTPAGIGESFHVLVASKGIAQENVSEMRGLNFGQTQLHAERSR